MTPIYRNYCLHCDWEVTIDDHNRDELATLAIEHACESGHDIDSQSMGKRDHASSTAHEHDDPPKQGT